MQDFLKKDAEWSRGLAIAEDKRVLRTALEAISHSRDSWFWLIGLTVIWAATEGTPRQMALFTAFGLALLAVIVLAIKFLIRRPRPAGDFGQVYRVTDPHSFPSGHAARAMAIASMFSTLGNFWLTVIALLWAILVGYSRVALALHYVSDVVVGWLIGLVSGWLAMLLFPYFIRLVSEYFPSLL